MQRKVFGVLIAMLLLALIFPASLYAAVVGRFTLVTGQVDLLKGGKLPAIPAKVQDGVEIGDVIRTKSKAKAQLTMVDDSVMTLGPESRLSIADYQYNPAREDRRAVVRLFHGIVHTVVKRIIKTEEPDFIMETHTATIGVRGTSWHTLLHPNSTLAALTSGILFVTPKVSGVKGILLHSSQYIQAPTPFVPQALTPAILVMLEQMMNTGPASSGLGSGFSLPAPATGSQFQAPLTPPAGPDQKLLQQTVPPVLIPQQQTPAPSHIGGTGS